MRCYDNKVQDFTDDFNSKSARMPLKDPGVEQHLKILYTDGLPKKLKEILLRDREYNGWSLTEVQAEAKRQQNIFLYMNRGQRWQNDGSGGGEQKQEGDDKPESSGNNNSNNNSGRGGYGGRGRGGGRFNNRGNNQNQNNASFNFWANVVTFDNSTADVDVGGLSVSAHRVCDEVS